MLYKNSLTSLFHGLMIIIVNYFKTSLLLFVVIKNVQYFDDAFLTGTILPYPAISRTLTIEIIIIFLLAFIEGVRIFLGM